VRIKTSFDDPLLVCAWSLPMIAAFIVVFILTISEEPYLFLAWYFALWATVEVSSWFIAAHTDAPGPTFEIGLHRPRRIA
jgi:hypothetical protein